MHKEFHVKTQQKQTTLEIIIYVMESGRLLTRSGLTGISVSLPWVIYYEAFYLHVVSSFSCIPVICPELVLFLIP